MTTYSDDYKHQRNEYSVYKKNETLPAKCSTNSHELPHSSLKDRTFPFPLTADQISDSHVPKVTLRTMTPQIPLTQITLNNLFLVADMDAKTIRHVTITDDVFESTRFRT